MPALVLALGVGGVADAAPVLASAVAGTPSRAQGFSPINVWNSSHCLDNATENAAKLQMWSCDSGSDEKWLEGFDSQTGLFTFTNQNTGRCITAPSSGAGTVTMAFCDAAATNQKWRVFYADNPSDPPAGWYQVWQNASSGLCLSTPSVRNRTLLQATPCDPSDQYDRWHQQ
ncbi:MULTISPECIES: RICIN domain-containing protein [Streptomyces]|uniref:RICIN domain-containing protein n=1 Tax=Streptomyces TaxID=1883 RepID=UPI0029313F7B|nr:RICIN domain-containing protein [Streptomyces sp. NEAU-HV9]